MSNIDEVKRCLPLCKTQCKIPQIVRALERTISPHGFRQSGNIGTYFGHNFDFVCEFAAMFEDRISQDIGGLFPSFDSLLDEGFIKL